MPRKKSASKRANNEGSVYQIKNGLWIAQATVTYFYGQFIINVQINSK